MSTTSSFCFLFIVNLLIFRNAITLLEKISYIITYGFSPFNLIVVLIFKVVKSNTDTSLDLASLIKIRLDF
jgi:hypothetical protein